jgi:hypothetical protein
VQELAQAVFEASGLPVPTTALRKAAIQWAGHCLNDLDGAALEKGLAISAAISRFLNEIEDRPKKED